MSAFLLCLAGWLAIAMGMDKHHEGARARQAGPAHLRRWRQAGWLVLLASLWLAAQAHTDRSAAVGATVWAVALSAAAVAATAAMTWAPRHAIPLASAALILAVPAVAQGW